MTLRVTSAWPPPISTSLMEIALPLPDEKTSKSSSLMVCAAGTVLTGASLTAVTVIGIKWLVDLAPPLPVLPRSFDVMAKLTDPLKLAFGA